jgi:hypothetical protein
VLQHYAGKMHESGGLHFGQNSNIRSGNCAKGRVLRAHVNKQHGDTGRGRTDHFTTVKTVAEKCIKRVIS